MEEGFLKERLDRFLKIIPTEYKVADEIKRSPKGFTITLERIPGSKGTYTAKIPKKAEEPKIAKVITKEESATKNKKKDLDDLLAGGMI